MKLALPLATLLLTAFSSATPLRAENVQHTNQLLSTKQCPGCNLQGAGLVLTDLSGADLRGANLSFANLSRADLRGANLMGADLSGASLNGANLNGAILIGATLSGTDLRDAYLVNANLLGTSLDHAYIQGTFGIPNYAGTPEDFHAWGTIESQHGNYRAAIDHFNKAIGLSPEFAPAYLGRGLALFRMGNYSAAERDATVAAALFEAQENPSGVEASDTFIEAIEIARRPMDARGGANLGNIITGIGSMLLRFLF
ncbi:MAG: pentapeptide repeat-containing protein [Cyanobacteriota bacterium]|nr:pentapeptide repeat-containing protein [Cyanobacteriota bacterium]